MTSTAPRQHTLELLRVMLGEGADFRPGQWEAIEAVAIQKKRGARRPAHGMGKKPRLFSCHQIAARAESGSHPAHQSAAFAHAEPN